MFEAWNPSTVSASPPTSPEMICVVTLLTVPDMRCTSRTVFANTLASLCAGRSIVATSSAMVPTPSGVMRMVGARMCSGVPSATVSMSTAW